MAPQSKVVFPQFALFPNEVKAAIALQALDMPGVHFFEIRKLLRWSDSAAWSISILATNDSRSSYKRIKELMFKVGCMELAYPIKLYIHKNYTKVNLPRSFAAIDSEQDLVVLRFSEKTSIVTGHWTVEWRTRHSSRCSIQRIRNKFKPFKKVAIYHNALCAPCAPWSPNRATSCICTDTPDHMLHAMCPEEVAQFLDCFDNLEKFYFLLMPRTREQRASASAYKSTLPCHSLDLFPG